LLFSTKVVRLLNLLASLSYSERDLLKILADYSARLMLTYAFPLMSS